MEEGVVLRVRRHSQEMPGLAAKESHRDVRQAVV
jgi:hypothetical protein